METQSQQSHTGGRPRTPRGAGQAGPRLLWSGCPGPGDGFVSGQTEPHVRICSGTALSQTLSGGAQLLEGSGVTAWAPHRANGHWGVGLPDPTGLTPRTRGTRQSRWELAPRTLSGRERAGSTGSRGALPALPSPVLPPQVLAQRIPAGRHLPDGLAEAGPSSAVRGTEAFITAHIPTINRLTGRTA